LPGLAPLVDRTEGWAAGLRLAALSLAGHPDPARLAAEFSGTERTVAEYLLAEVLDRQGEQVRRLLLRTSILDSVNGELADLLTGGWRRWPRPRTRRSMTWRRQHSMTWRLRRGP
jgi:LuxR family maltose regulon positive regulatory protein